MRKAIGAFGLALFFLMLFVPHAYRQLKAGLLIFVLGGSALLIVWRDQAFDLHPQVTKWALILSLTCAFFIVLGLINDAPGAMDIRSLYFLAPMLFAALISIISKEGLRMIMSTLVTAAVAIGLYGSMFIANAKGWWPDAFYWKLDQGQAIGFYDGYVEYNLYSISTMVALVPMLAVALIEWGNRSCPLARIWLWVGFSACLGLAILSGRRALWIVLMMTPLIYITLLMFLPKERRNLRQRLPVAGRLFAISTVVFLLLSTSFELDAERMFAYLIAGVPTSQTLDASAPPDASASLRYQQALALWHGWQARPWLGHGHGAVAAVIRNEERPWQYELSYLALLFHTGILGILLYAACIVWIYWQGLRVIRCSDSHGPWMLAALTGTSAVLIAHATNPYLYTFDSMWPIFLPVAIINRYLLEKAQGKEAT